MGGFLCRKKKKKFRKREEILELISGSDGLVIDPIGSDYEVRSTDVFKKVDKFFKEDWGPDSELLITDKTIVDVYEVKKDATFIEDEFEEKEGSIFGSTIVEWEQCFLTRPQITEFVKRYPDWLRKDGYGTFFLTKEYNYLIAGVALDGDGSPKVSTLWIGTDEFCYGKFRHRVVVPRK